MFGLEAMCIGGSLSSSVGAADFFYEGSFSAVPGAQLQWHMAVSRCCGSCFETSFCGLFADPLNTVYNSDVAGSSFFEWLHESNPYVRGDYQSSRETGSSYGNERAIVRRRSPGYGSKSGNAESSASSSSSSSGFKKQKKLAQARKLLEDVDGEYTAFVRKMIEREQEESFRFG